MAEESGIWRTVRGHRIFIPDGMTPSQVFQGIRSGERFANGKQKPKLTDDEQAAVNSYISGDSYVLNEKLRANEDLTPAEQYIVDNLDTALAKMPKYEGVVVRDLTFINEDARAAFIEGYRPGERITYRAYTSTSTDDGYSDAPDVRMYIRSKNGRDIRAFNSAEREVLFVRGTSIVIDSVTEQDGTLIINATEE